MIFNASLRSHAISLSSHLMNARDNEHVELLDLRGFLSDDLETTLEEYETIAKGTRCHQHLFSLSLSPPQEQSVSIEAFEAAVAMVEQELGLDDQPPAIVFYKKKASVTPLRSCRESMIPKT